MHGTLRVMMPLAKVIRLAMGTSRGLLVLTNTSWWSHMLLIYFAAIMGHFDVPKTLRGRPFHIQKKSSKGPNSREEAKLREGSRVVYYHTPLPTSLRSNEKQAATTTTTTTTTTSTSRGFDSGSCFGPDPKGIGLP